MIDPGFDPKFKPKESKSPNNLNDTTLKQMAEKISVVGLDTEIQSQCADKHPDTSLLLTRSNTAASSRV